MTTLRCRVILLDDTVIERELEKKAVGQVLFNEVCEFVSLLERDYFGLAAWDSSNNKVWLDLSKQVRKQIISPDATFTFSVKFYPPDPSELAEDITRYLLCLQLRTDILTERLLCPSDMLAVLGSYTIQSEFGDYNPELHGKEFFRNIALAPNQTPELEENVIERHRTLTSMSPAQADELFLQNVKTLDMYGVHLHSAKDATGGDVTLGICADGLVMFEDEEKTQSFIWPHVVNMSYKHNNFHVRILDSEDTCENTIKFILPSYRACKYLWRIAVEHHAFFRNNKDLDKRSRRLLCLGSKFLFTGLTHAESLEASSTIKRPAPRFSRSAIKRKAKESLLVALKRPNRSEFDDWFQVLGTDESWPTFHPDVFTDKDNLTNGESLVYKERVEVNNRGKEWFQLFGARSFQTQRTLSSLSSDTDVLQSPTFTFWKLHTDDWFVLLEPHTHQPPVRASETRPLSPQSSRSEEQREELDWVESTSENSIKVVKIRKEGKTLTEQHEELEMERSLTRSDAVDNQELDMEANEQILKAMREKMEREGDGAVMYEQRTEELYTRQYQEVYVEQRTRGMEVIDTVHEMMLKSGQVVSEENIETLEETLQEVQSIEQRLQDLEKMKVRLQQVEFLEQRLQQAGRQQRESDDWYILLEHKLIESSAPARLIVVKNEEQRLQEQERGEKGDWYLLLDQKPMASAVYRATATTEQKTDLMQRIEKELQRANTVTDVQMKDDWYILLELPAPYTQSMQPVLTPSETDIQASWVHVVEEQKNTDEENKWREEKVIHVRETRPTLPAQREDQTQQQVEDDWFIQLDVSSKKSDVVRLRSQQAVMIEEKEVTFDKKPMIVEEKQVIVGVEKKPHATAREDEDNWFVLFSPAQLEKVIAAVPMTLISEDVVSLGTQQTVMTEEKEVTFDKKPVIIKGRRVIVEKNISASVREDEDWFVLFSPSQIEKKAVDTVPMTLISEDVVSLRTQQKVKIEEKEVTFAQNPIIIKEKQVIVGGVEKNINTRVRKDEDKWYLLFSPARIEKKAIDTVPMTLISEELTGLRTRQTVAIKEKEVTFERKPMIIKEKQVIGGVEKKFRATLREDDDNWFVLFSPVRIEKKAIDTGVSDTRILEENRLKEVQKKRLREDIKRSHVVEDRRHHISVPGPKAETRLRVHYMIDDWFMLLEPASKKSVSIDKRAEEDWRRKEEMLKKQAMAEDKRNVAGFKPPVIPMTPSDQPMTSTPTAQYVRITRPTYQEESLKRIDITQDITQDIKQESKVEAETIIKRKRREKRIDGESIYIRHSILMLEDSDVTQEVVLRHHASISELKRVFMEDIPLSCPTEWDKRLSTYIPAVFPELYNGELFTSIEIMRTDGLLAM